MKSCEKLKNRNCTGTVFQFEWSGDLQLRREAQLWQPSKAELHEFTNTIDTKLKKYKCTNFKKNSPKLNFRILIYKNYTLDELNFIQKLLTPAHRWQKCARKTLGTHDWICKVALSSEVIMTIVLGREKMMQLMIWIRYNRIKQFTLIYASVL